MHRSQWEFITPAKPFAENLKGRFVPIVDRDRDSEAQIFAMWASQLQIQDLRQPENTKCEFLTYVFLETWVQFKSVASGADHVEAGRRMMPVAKHTFHSTIARREDADDTEAESDGNRQLESICRAGRMRSLLGWVTRATQEMRITQNRNNYHSNMMFFNVKLMFYSSDVC